MKLRFLAALAVVTGTGIATHADERPTTTQQTIDTSLERRIENALRDLEIFNARALTVAPLRRRALLRTGRTEVA